MKQHPKNAQFKTSKIKRVEFLSATLQRLQDDVGTILRLVDEYNSKAVMKKERVVGFWASLRMILPIIEAVARAENIRPQELLGNHLNIATPYLMWDLFRNSLTHGDYVQGATYNNKQITWGVQLNTSGHIIKSGHIGISIPTLYQDLVGYLQNEVTKNDQTLIDVEIGVEYGVNGVPKPSVIADFSRL